MNEHVVEKLIGAAFPAKHVKAMIRHFKAMGEELSGRRWEDSIGKAGKFVEAALKGLYVCGTGQAAPSGKAFKADAIINALGGLPKGGTDDTIRILIPRSCRCVYDIASNRGGRHDPDEIDPNEMDATITMSNCAWILAEMVRYAQKGAVDPAKAKDIVSSLIERKYPLIEEVDGRIYFHGHKKSATDVALVALAYRHPGRISKQDLVDIVKRHRFTAHNAAVAVSRIMKYVDESTEGFRLLTPGLAIAERLLSSDTSVG